jgi:hypothetical protein
MKQRTRVEFTLPFQPKLGMAVMNQLAEEIGVIVEVAAKVEQDPDGNYVYRVKADVTDASAQFQVFEQPVSMG